MIVPGVLAALAVGRGRRPGQRAGHHRAQGQRVHRHPGRRADHPRLPGGELHGPGRRRAAPPSSISATTGSGPIPVSTDRARDRVAVAWWFLNRTRPGYHMYAVGGDREVARLSGSPHRPDDRAGPRPLLGPGAGWPALFLASRLGSGAPYVGTDAGYDLESIAAVVLGGTLLAGGRGGVAGHHRRRPDPGHPGHDLRRPRRQPVLQGRGAWRRPHRRGRALRPQIQRGAPELSTTTTETGPPPRHGSGSPRAPFRCCVVLLALLIALAIASPAYAEPAGYLALLKRAAPLMILAIGQYFVIVVRRVRPVRRLAGDRRRW